MKAYTGGISINVETDYDGDIDHTRREERYRTNAGAAPAREKSPGKTFPSDLGLIADESPDQQRKRRPGRTL
ncbi:MAG: hypothetical protein R3B93_10535 [Bacteroidia bacterium]